MALLPVIAAKESKSAFRRLKRRLTDGGERLRRVIGWQGGNYEDDVYWNAKEGFWVAAGVLEVRGRFWCPFGTENPRLNQTLAISVECNPPIKGVNHRCAGAFLTDGKKVYIAHSGKIGGGRKGIGKTAFVASYLHGSWQPVQWPDGRASEMIVIGAVDGRRLPTQVGAFIRHVEDFKRNIGMPPAELPSGLVKSGFSPEFGGQRRPYRGSDEIESTCDHGPVVNELKARLEQLGVKELRNDRQRDLFIWTAAGKLRVLFEVKTSVSPHSIYEGIGQLIYHSTGVLGEPRRCLVLPESPNATTQTILTKIGIEVITYRWAGSRPVFGSLSRFLE